MTVELQSWQKVFRDGIQPLLSTHALQVLKEALEKDDERLVQGATTTPPPLPSVQDWPVEAACVLGYCGWQGENLPTVAEVEEYFARLCFSIDERLGEPAGCRWFINWYDETPREEMRTKLLAEVELALGARYLKYLMKATGKTADQLIQEAEERQTIKVLISDETTIPTRG